MSSFYMFSQWRRLIFLWIFVEERAPVHVGITDPVVAIDIQRAGIAPIVSIAQEDNAPEATSEDSTCFRADAEADAKVKTNFDFPKYILHKMRKMAKFKILATASR